MLIVSQFLLWVVVAILAIAVLALGRQLGALRERIASMDALAADNEPTAGDKGLVKLEDPGGDPGDRFRRAVLPARRQ